MVSELSVTVCRGVGGFVYVSLLLSISFCFVVCLCGEGFLANMFRRSSSY